jgi:dTDP-4-dehydrorhamnose 3,5-epimerase/CDP-3, 6-dideoxy-D-glycero-D-glycero-4-hexulose-5-epimerase
MIFDKTNIPGVYEILFRKFEDTRGVFVKTWNSELFSDNGVSFQSLESFYSISAKDVLRGMHFQLPPYQHAKLVYCPIGSILDVILDIRIDSPAFGKCVAIELSETNNKAIYLPEGCAHGFLSLSDNSMTVYQVSTIHSPAADQGILWNSFGFNWPIDSPLISSRDSEFPEFQMFNSPFKL